MGKTLSPYAFQVKIHPFCLPCENGSVLYKYFDISTDTMLNFLSVEGIVAILQEERVLLLGFHGLSKRLLWPRQLLQN